MVPKRILQTIILTVSLIAHIQSTQAAYKQCPKNQSSSYALPSSLLFESTFAPQTRIHLLLTCIETAANKASSASDFNQYLWLYGAILQISQPRRVMLLAPTDRNAQYDTIALRTDVSKKKLQTIVNALANNTALCHNNTYLNNLLTVINTILAVFGIVRTDDELSNIFEYLEDVCTPCTGQSTLLQGSKLTR